MTSEKTQILLLKRKLEIVTSQINLSYFDNTFYVGKLHEDYRYLDYSEPIRTWGLNRGIKLGESVSMQSVTVADLTIRFGYPYHASGLL